MTSFTTAKLQRPEFQSHGRLDGLICFYEFEDLYTMSVFQSRGQYALSSHAISIFLYQFKDRRFYLSKCRRSPVFDPALIGSNVAGYTLAAVVERCLRYEVDPVTQQFKNPADETVFLLSYEKYLNE